MIKFTDGQLRKIKQSVEFAYDADDVSEARRIVKKMDEYLESEKTGEKSKMLIVKLVKNTLVFEVPKNKG